MKQFKKALIIFLILAISAVGCKISKKSDNEVLFDSMISFWILVSLSNSITCTNTGTNHYFGTATGYDQTTVYLRSADGSCWEKYSGTGPTVKYSATGTNISVTTDGSKPEIYYTTDGQTYTKATTPTFTGYVADLKFFNGAFYAALSDSTVKILTSTDGKTWTKPANNLLTLSWVGKVTGYANGGTNYLLATANSSTCPILNRSTDGGATWTASGTCVWAGSYAISSLMSGNSTVIGFDITGQMLKSTDHGTSFTQTYPLSGRISSNNILNGLGFFSGKFFVQGYRNSVGYPVFTSTDGSTWTEIAATNFVGSTNVTLMNNVVLGAGNRLVSPVYYSDDGGTSWKKSTGYKEVLSGGAYITLTPTHVIYIP